ncbi:hypothetical protein GCM10027359_11870 [Marilutibacter aestuarii]
MEVAATRREGGRDDGDRAAFRLTCLAGGETVPQPISLAYRFVFEQHEGRGTARIGP